MDASGKSSLCNELLMHLNDNADLGYKLIHSGGPEKHPGEILERVQSLPVRGKFILDRHPMLSQYVYARTDKVPPPTTFTLKSISTWLRSLPQLPVLVWCVGRAPHTMKEGESEDHALFLQRKWEDLNSRYHNLFFYFAAEGIPYLTYDFSSMFRERVVGAIIAREANNGS